MRRPKMTLNNPLLLILLFPLFSLLRLSLSLPSSVLFLPFRPLYAACGLSSECYVFCMCKLTSGDRLSKRLNV